MACANSLTPYCITFAAVLLLSAYALGDLWLCCISCLSTLQREEWWRPNYSFHSNCHCIQSHRTDPPIQSSLDSNQYHYRDSFSVWMDSGTKE